jgi:hypothetical protein
VFSASCLALLALAPGGCGKKGPPLAPLRPVPARVEDLTVRRLGNDVYLQFTIPARNADGSAPADLTRMEAYAITGDPQDPLGRPLEARDFLRFATLVAATDVEPPPPPAPEEGAPPPPAPPDPRPAQGERVTLVETLLADVQTPWVHPRSRPVPERLPAADEPADMAGPVWPRVEEPLGRIYVVTGRSRRREAGPLSARLLVPLSEVPEAPGALAVRHDETKIYLTWTPPPGARLPLPDLAAMAGAVSGPAGPAPPAGAPAVSNAAGTPSPAPVASPVQATPPADAPLPSRPIFAGAIPHTYNVYDHSVSSGQLPVMPAPINPSPLGFPAFEDVRLAFGVERCYVVRTVEAWGNVTAESPASAPVCVTPRDTFPPAAPRGLAAVAAEGAVSLIWEPSPEPDLAGYIVLRGEAPGDTLQALTAVPIRDTTFRDATATPGGRYVYAIVAVDTATPQNVSLESNRVEETAR